MKHFVLGYTHPSRKGAVTVLYAGDSRAEARTALFAGGEDIVLTDYICNPQISQSKRHRAAATAAPQETQPETDTAPVEDAPAPVEVFAARSPKKEKPLALPPKAAPDPD